MAPSNSLSVQDVKGLHKELSKAMDAKADKDVTVILGKLKEGVVASEDLIRVSSGVSMELANLDRELNRVSLFNTTRRPRLASS